MTFSTGDDGAIPTEGNRLGTMVFDGDGSAAAQVVHDAVFHFIANESDRWQAAHMAVRALRSLPIEQRMEAMGMTRWCPVEETAMPQFCEECDVSLDLHYGEDDCDGARLRAGVVEGAFGGLLRGR